MVTVRNGEISCVLYHRRLNEKFRDNNLSIFSYQMFKQNKLRGNLLVWQLFLGVAGQDTFWQAGSHFFPSERKINFNSPLEVGKRWTSPVREGHVCLNRSVCRVWGQRRERRGLTSQQIGRCWKDGGVRLDSLLESIIQVFVHRPVR